MKRKIISLLIVFSLCVAYLNVNIVNVYASISNSTYTATIGSQTIPFADYPVGSYFTDNGSACNDHSSCGSGSWRNDTCNCKSTWNGVALNSTSCYGFANMVFYRLFGHTTYSQTTKVVSNISASTINSSYLYNLFTNGTVKAGAHIRNSTHSMIFMGCDSSYIYTYEGNYDGHCRVGVIRRTWSEMVTYLQSKNGIAFIQMPNSYPDTYTEAPSNPKLSISTNKVAVGETITFNYSVNNAEHIYIPIDVNGVREHYIEVTGNTYSTSFSKPGTYCAALFARNSIGESGFSEWVTFEVYNKAPSNPKLSVSSNKVAVGEVITFNYSVDDAVSMYIPIDVDGVREHYIEVSGNSYTTSFSKPGIYCAALFARNSLGESGFSEWVTFEVSADAPSNPKLAIYTSKVPAGQNILFEYSVENASHMYIAIDVNGVREHYIEVSGDHYNASFTKPGIYHAALFARNEAGYESGFSNWVCFEVYNEGPTNCDITSNKTVYNTGEDVTLDFEATHGVNYELKIYKDDIHILSYWAEDGKNNENYVVNFEYDGVYKIYVVAYNYYYHATSEPIYITVGKYSILYNSDADKNTPSYQTKIYNNNITLASEIPIKQGYTFTCWNTKADGSGVSYNPGATYTENNNLVLYAQWESVIPNTESTVTKSGAKLIIDMNVHNINSPFDILIVGYKENRLVTMKRVLYNEQNSPYTLEGDIDEIKVMVWNKLYNLKPLCDAEIVTSSDFIIE